MKSLFYLLIAVVMLFSACKMDSRNSQNNPIPQALNNEPKSISLKSRSGNLVEELYNELLEKDTVLNKLENSINNIVATNQDATLSFNNYNNKNLSYYNSAKNYINSIQDSVLKNNMKTMIENEMKNYDTLILAHTNLLSQIDKNNISIQDLHIALRLLKTIPIINQYQKDNLPKTDSMESFIKNQNNIIEQLQKTMK